MQKSISFFLILLLCGCKLDKDTRVFDNQKVFVVGHIDDQINDKIVLTFDDKRLVETLNNGNFRFEIDLDKSIYASFNHGDQLHDLFLQPGDSLNINFKPSDPNPTLVYSGARSIENQFLNEKKILKSSFQLNNTTVFNKSPKAFSEITNRFQLEVAELLKKYMNEYPEMDPLFKKQQSYLTKYEMGSLLLDYPLFKNDGFDDTKLPVNYFDFLSDIELNNPVIQNTQAYHSFIRSYIARKTKLATQVTQINQVNQPLAWTQSKIGVIETEVTLPNIRANLITESIEWHLYNYACVNIDSLITIFKSTNPDPDDALRINSFANRCQALRPGKVAPTFSGIDPNGKVFMSSSFIGKNIYIDVWATWCGPCKKETPYFEELIKQYKDNPNIAFISISFDEKKEMWDRYLKKHPLNGIQLISPKAFESKMANSYGISNIPRYILIDKEGKLINADAPLPSSTEIKSILAKLAAS